MFLKSNSPGISRSRKITYEIYQERKIINHKPLLMMNQEGNENLKTGKGKQFNVKGLH